MTNGTGARQSLLAVASLTSALIVFFPPAWIAAIVLGVVALVEIKQSGGALRGRGLAIAAIALSLVWTVLLVIVLMASLGGGTRQDTADLFPPAQEEPLGVDEGEEPAATTPTPATAEPTPATAPAPAN